MKKSCIRREILKTISHADLLQLWERARRNGALRKLGYVKRGLFSAALEYTRKVGEIVHPKLVGIIDGMADLIRNTIGRRIWRHGMNRARAWLNNAKVMAYFPHVRKWLCEDPYIFWLGTDLLAKRRAWVFLPYSR